MNKKLFLEYNKLIKDLKELEDKKKKLSNELLNEMQKEEVATVKAEFGTFSLVERKTYTFPKTVKEKVSKLKEQIKEIEQDSIDNKKVKIKTSESLRFQPNKNN